jgi:hypothetical protein
MGFLLGGITEGNAHEGLTSGPSSEESTRVSFMGIFQWGSSSEEPLRTFPNWRAPPGMAPRSHSSRSDHRAFSLVSCSSERFPWQRLFGAYTAGPAPPSVSPGSSSSEELTRDSLTGRFPKRLLFGGTTEGPAHECLQLWSLFGGIMAGLAHGCLPRRLLFGGTTEELIHRRTPKAGSSEPSSGFSSPGLLLEACL